MKIAVCDDDIQCIAQVCALLEQWSQQKKIALTLYHFSDGDELLRAHQKRCMDLIILDIMMPLLSGLDTAKELRNKDDHTTIIFLSSSKEYAVDSYEVHALDYLLKPVSPTQLFDSMDYFFNMSRQSEKYFPARTANGFCKLRIADIEYLEAMNKQVNVHMTDSSVIEIHEQFAKCEQYFTQEIGFFKCHRSYIVHMRYIEQFTKISIITCHQVTIPVSRNSYSAFKNAYLNYMFKA